MAKLSFLRKDQKEHLKGEVGQAKRGTGPEMMKYQGLKMAGCLDIYLGGHEHGDGNQIWLVGWQRWGVWRGVMCDNDCKGA